MRNMHFCPKGPAICKILQQIVMKLGNSKQAVLFGIILPFKDITQIQKKVTIEKLSKSGLRRCTKFGEASSNDEQKNNTRKSLILHFIRGFLI